VDVPNRLRVIQPIFSLPDGRAEHRVCQDVPFHSLSYLIVILSYHTIWLHQGLNPGPVDTWPGLDPAMI